MSRAAPPPFPLLIARRRPLTLRLCLGFVALLHRYCRRCCHRRRRRLRFLFCQHDERVAIVAAEGHGGPVVGIARVNRRYSAARRTATPAGGGGGSGRRCYRATRAPVGDGVGITGTPGPVVPGAGGSCWSPEAVAEVVEPGVLGARRLFSKKRGSIC